MKISILTFLAFLVVFQVAAQPHGARPPGFVVGRHARYADSSRLYLDSCLHNSHSKDEAAHFDSLARHYRLLESERQHVYTDSGWRSEMRQHENGWRPYTPVKKGGTRASALGLWRFFAVTNDIFTFCPGEYVPMDVDQTTGTFYAHASTGIPTALSGMTNASIPIGGPHNACGITKDGKFGCYGQWLPNGTPNGTGASNMTQIIFDSTGNYLDSVYDGFLSGNNYGTFWNGGIITHSAANGWRGYVFGELEGYNEGNNTWGNPYASKPVLIILPGGRGMRKIQGGYFFVALATDSTVWDWGGNGYNFWLGQTAGYKTPTQVPLPSGYKATDIASNGVFTWVICVDASGNQQIIGWAQQYYEDYMCLPDGSLTGSVLNLTSRILPTIQANNAGHKIAHMYVSSNATYAITDNGILWGWGGSPCGELGTGLEMAWWAHGPFFWDFGPHECQARMPVRICPGVRNFKKVWTCQSNSFYTGFEDSTGQMYGAGRSKGMAIPISMAQDSSSAEATADYLNGNIGASYPDSWGHPYITKLHIAKINKNYQVTSPVCIKTPSSAYCNLFTPPAFSAITGSISATVNNSDITLDATALTSGNPLWKILWYQTDSTTAPGYLNLGAPTGAIEYITSMGPKDTAIKAGIYNMGLRVISVRNDTTYYTVQAVVNVGAPTANAGADQVIYAPSTTTTVSGSGTGSAGATITGYLWTQLSGPTTVTFGTPTTASSTVNNLAIGGPYTLQLRVTDSNGNTATSTMKITVTQSFNGLTVPLPSIFIHKTS